MHDLKHYTPTIIPLVLFVLVLAAASGCRRSTASPGEAYSFAIGEGERILDSLREHGKVPGIDVAVAIGREIIWSQGFGHASLEHGTPVRPGVTRFRIGSVSKPLTVAALAKLMDQGKVNLDAPVTDYVPYFPAKKFPFTVRQLAGHLAGIRHYRAGEFLLAKRYPSVRASLSIFDQDSLLFEPGTAYSYSSYGYNLLSAVIEGASGEPFLPFIQREVFDALGMTATTPDFNDRILSDRTEFYQLDSTKSIVNAPYVDNSYKWAGGGFLSTTTDLVKFGQAHLKGGFLSEATLRAITTSQVLRNGDSTEYGAGWRTYHTAGLRGYGHSGGSVGGITQFRVYPEKEMIVVLLSNSSDTQFGDIPDRIAQLFADVQ